MADRQECVRLEKEFRVKSMDCESFAGLNFGTVWKKYLTIRRSKWTAQRAIWTQKRLLYLMCPAQIPIILVKRVANPMAPNPVALNPTVPNLTAPNTELSDDEMSDDEDMEFQNAGLEM